MLKSLNLMPSLARTICEGDSPIDIGFLKEALPIYNLLVSKIWNWWKKDVPASLSMDNLVAC